MYINAHCTCVHAQTLSCVWFHVTPWTIAHQAPLSMGLSKQEYWNVLPFPPAEDLPESEMEPVSPASPALAGRFTTTEPTGKPINTY